MKTICAISVCCALTLTSPAIAISLSEDGAIARMRGGIGPGDDKVFREFLAQQRPQPIKVLWLSSHGGDIAAGVGIARAVRAAKLTTAVDATGAYCDSSCTMVFAGGVRRHYVGGDRVSEGFEAQTGLGYHQAHKRTASARIASEVSTKGSDRMSALYAEMGQPGAAQLASRAPFNVFYRISGATALKLRIATSLSEP